MSLYLVTGAAGFIGSSLAHALVDSGHQVRGIDDLSNGSLANLEAIREAVDFRRVDIRDLDGVRTACAGVDYVLHHAAVASVPQSVEDPIGTHAINVTGTLNVLVAARQAGVRRVVFAASSAAYGNEGSGARLESMSPAPLSPYAVQKLAGELYVRNFAALYGLEGVCLRYFNIFGPRQAANSPYSGVIAQFIRRMLAGEAPTIFGTGEQSRDFTYIDNVIQANLLACTAPAEQVSGRVFNIGTGRGHDLNALWAALARILHFEGQPVYGPARSGDVLHSLADISAARHSLGYDPRADFETGLRETVEWYMEQEEDAAGKGMRARQSRIS